MSLQSDFELCLEYAEMLEAKQAQQLQAQNNISFLHSESERLKGKMKICAIVPVVALAFMAIVFFNSLGSRNTEMMDVFFSCLIPIIALAVSLFICIKTKKEYDALESQKPFLIQQYAREADECGQEINRLIREIYSENLLDIVPADYFSVAAIEFCLTQVRNKLADTPREAFQLLNAEIKRLEHMEYLEEMNCAQIEELNNIKRAIQINTLVTWVEGEKYRR